MTATDTRYATSLVFLLDSCVGDGRSLFGLHHPDLGFPNTDFPRVVIGVDNGVMPIDQMMVTHGPSGPSNSVPGLQQVRSITSRGSAEINLFFDWHVDMVTTLQLVDAALSPLGGRCPQPQFRRIALTLPAFPSSATA